MNIDKFGIVSLSPDDYFNLLYSGKKFEQDQVLISDSKEVERYNSALKENADNFSKLNFYQEITDSLDLFDEANQCEWFMPDEYKDFPIHTWLLDQCKTEQEKTRVDQELELFIQHGMFDLLFYLKYLVDTMREHKIVWGVGRGSSVASYVLYLLGIHKINSIKYDLDIKEFLK